MEKEIPSKETNIDLHFLLVLISLIASVLQFVNTFNDRKYLMFDFNVKVFLF